MGSVTINISVCGAAVQIENHLFHTAQRQRSPNQMSSMKVLNEESQSKALKI